MQYDTVTTEPEVVGLLGAAGGSDYTSNVDFEERKESSNIYMDSEGSDTGEETKELVKKLMEIKQKEKVTKTKKGASKHKKGKKKKKPNKNKKKEEHSKMSKDKGKD
ncbi:Hypothetical predicted protein [Mytilus galloprovincialis]|uniref:Uncharacterized protein n=1 Tax=Mytilus galloprovincialis TaxID=29158 RepID=A0A8B6DU05_MYTGA|nr:Hypothetical predicted protein [Mytilus galloprovincialis]